MRDLAARSSNQTAAAPAIALDDLYLPEELVAAHPKTLTRVALAWQLRHRDQNGLDRACVRVGRRLLISKSRYEQWLAEQAGAPLIRKPRKSSIERAAA